MDMTDTLTTPYQVRMLNPSDLSFLLRASVACQYEAPPMEREVLEAALWAGLPGFVLTGPNVRMCIVIQPVDRNVASLGLFFREGPPVGLLTQTQMLWDKVMDYLQQNGVSSVCAWVHKDNPKRNKLLKLYARIGFLPEMVRIGRSI